MARDRPVSVTVDRQAPRCSSLRSGMAQLPWSGQEERHITDSGGRNGKAPADGSRRSGGNAGVSGRDKALQARIDASCELLNEFFADGWPAMIMSNADRKGCLI